MMPGGEGRDWGAIVCVGAIGCGYRGIWVYVNVKSIEVKALFGLFSNVEHKLLSITPTRRAIIGRALNDNSRMPLVRRRNRVCMTAFFN
jgi:hypothetical protein